jgi:cytochrome c-type biogenesis protein CcmE
MIGAFVIVLAIAYLMVNGLRDNATYYLEINEVLAKSSDLNEQRIRMGGKVLPGSISVDTQNLIYDFQIHQDGQSIEIHYQGTTPDIFGDNINVIIEGKMQGNGVFHADILTAQCPSKMVARVEQSSLEKAPHK